MIALFLSVYCNLNQGTLEKSCKYINKCVADIGDLTKKDYVKLVKYAEKALRYLLGIEKETNLNTKKED